LELLDAEEMAGHLVPAGSVFAFLAGIARSAAVTCASQSLALLARGFA
jgi:hypothetical protein